MAVPVGSHVAVSAGSRLMAPSIMPSAAETEKPLLKLAQRCGERIRRDPMEQVSARSCGKIQHPENQRASQREDQPWRTIRLGRRQKSNAGHIQRVQSVTCKQIEKLRHVDVTA